QLTPVVPIQGVTSSTRRQNAAQGATTLRKRAGERPGSRRRNNIVAAAVRALEDSGANFEDFIKMLRRQNVIRSSVSRDGPVAHRNYTVRVPGGQIDIVCVAEDCHLPLDIEAFENIVKVDLMFQIEMGGGLVQQQKFRILCKGACKHCSLAFAPT